MYKQHWNFSHAKFKRQVATSQENFTTPWLKIHFLLELQRTEIRASFKQSMTIVQHKFGKVQKLWGFISILSLDLILHKLKRFDIVGVYLSSLQVCYSLNSQPTVCTCDNYVQEKLMADTIFLTTNDSI